MTKKNAPDLLDAVSVLADAVRRERIPGVVEFRQLEDALKEIAVEPDDNRWATADAAFKALDPDLRQRVADRARQLAHKEAKIRRGDPPAAVPAAAMTAASPPPPTPAPKPEPKKPGASPFLSALNRGRLGSR